MQATHTFYYYILPPLPPAFLVCITVVTYFKQLGQHLLFLLIPYPCMHFLFQ